MSAFTKSGRISAAAVIILCLFSSVFAYSGGSGEPNNPYQIGIVADWQQLMNTSSHWNRYFIMTADVNLYGIPLTPVGNSTTNFTGVFDGNNHVISNVVINTSSSDYVGLFGYLRYASYSSGGKIRNLGIENVNMTGHSYVGGLVGYSYSGSTISKCYATGTVSSSGSYAGGLVGYNYDGGIYNCYSTGAVNGSSNVGGLVGNIYMYSSGSIISNCYSTGAVSGSSNVGGLVGSGTSIAITASFWDIETSGRTTSAGGTGKTTAEMKILSTFTSAGWFISDINGSDTDWIMLPDGQDYPKIIYFVYRDPTATVPLLGDGTQQNPYQIGLPADIISLSQYSSVWNKHIILTADLDMNGFTVRPIGNSIIKFTGSFNGQGFVIRNATINLPNKDYVGLFGFVGSGGVITNLGIEDVNIIGKRFVGGLVGYNSKGIISNCYSTGLVAGNSSSYSYVGGLIGLSSGCTISNCYSTVSASGAGATIGGLVGGNTTGGTISNCSAAGAITDNDPNEFGSRTGGLVGNNGYGTIANCSATGNVSASSSANISIGGLVGDSGCGTTISNCYATGNVQTISTSSSATVCGGGLVGLKDSGDVNSCYSTGNVTCDTSSDPNNNYVGGMIGLNFEGTVNHCYSKGAVIANESGLCVGGFTGLNLGGTIYGCFWDISASGKTTSAGGRGLTTEQMKTMSNYQNAGWADKGWVIQDGIDYPHLEWEGTAGTPIPASSPVELSGSGTAEYPYQIWTTQDFAIWGQYASVLDKHTILMADLDLHGVLLNPIGEYGLFTGTFDGNGHVIRNITIIQPTNSYVGLFGGVGTGGAVIHLGIEDVNIVGGDYVGGLIGKNEGGTVSDCYLTGTTVGGDYVGGLIGKNEGGTVSNCYSAGTTVGLARTGGLLGSNEGGTVSNCHSAGTVIVWDSNDSNDIFYSSYAGGLVGYNGGGNISNCYSTGSVSGNNYVGGLVGYKNSGTVTASFWDTETSGKTTSAGGTGKTTEQMQDVNTFLTAGWDFVGETANGTADIWFIRQGIEYPKFVTQDNRPTANAGPDQTLYAWIDGKTDAALDGSDSNDLDGDAISYKWTWKIGTETYDVNGVNPTILLPVGVHTIQLIVNDGIVDSIPDDVNITVIAPLKSKLQIMPCVLNRDICDRHKHHHKPAKILAIIRLPEGIARKDIDNTELLTIYPGGIKAQRQWIFPYYEGDRRHRKLLTAIWAYFDRDDILDAIPVNGKVELKAVGKLKTGRYFYGCDTVRIIAPPPPPPRHFPRK